MSKGFALVVVAIGALSVFAAGCGQNSDRAETETAGITAVCEGANGTCAVTCSGDKETTTCVVSCEHGDGTTCECTVTCDERDGEAVCTATCSSGQDVTLTCDGKNITCEHADGTRCTVEHPLGKDCRTPAAAADKVEVSSGTPGKTDGCTCGKSGSCPGSAMTGSGT